VPNQLGRAVLQVDRLAVLVLEVILGGRTWSPLDGNDNSTSC
jgi:hypothetical protein